MPDEPIDAILQRVALMLDRLATSHAQQQARLDLLAEAAVHHSERLDRHDMLMAAHAAELAELRTAHAARLDRLDAMLAAQQEINASLKEMLARMIRQEPNGRRD